MLRLLYKGWRSRQKLSVSNSIRQGMSLLAAAKEHIKVLKKKLDKAEKTKDQAEQDGYDVGVAETNEALRGEVSGVCRTYYLQM